MKVKIAPAAAKTIRGLPPGPKRRIKAAILELPNDSMGHKGILDVKRLRSPVIDVAFYRLRVGNWRVVYRHQGTRLEVMRVFHRREGYGWMDRLGY